MSQVTALASAQINASDTIVVDLFEADLEPAVVIITWPAKATVLHPQRFPDAAAAIVKLFSDAHIVLAAFKAERRL